MNQITMMANIVGCIVVIFVAVAFITLAIFYFAAQKKLIRGGWANLDIQKDVDLQLSKIRGRYSSVEEAERYFAYQKKRSATVRRTVWTIFIVLYLAVIGLIVFSNTVAGDRHVWLGDTAMLTIQTGSMASANLDNAYLFDENGIADESDRILQYSFITISKAPALIEAIQPGDIVAFTMRPEAGDGASAITIVHRLICIEQDENGKPLYTFRGDANPSSLAGESRIPAEQIVGVFETAGYQGAKNVPLGYFVTYLRSSTGIAMTAVALLLMLIYQMLSDRLDRVYERQYITLRRQALEKRVRAEQRERERLARLEATPTDESLAKGALPWLGMGIGVMLARLLKGDGDDAE